ncbi:MAG: hypothetical protein WAW17_33610 [Rhodococcus sp. (in: high G+C Gram-positive bacteria)]|uniref:hypothetical protein n=1 Tax=Rhodococcus sp. TaxID=1831 RepID=UPI003BB02B2F
MSRRALLIKAEWLGALLAVVLAAWFWELARVTSEFGPIAPEAPSYKGTKYSGAWIAGAAALVTVSGLLLIDSIRRTRCDGDCRPAAPAPSPEDPGLAHGVGSGTVEHRGSE